jgi:putative membrane protein
MGAPAQPAGDGTVLAAYLARPRPKSFLRTVGATGQGRAVSAVFDHWSFDPFLIGVVVLAAVHGRGLARRLRAIDRSGRPVAPWLGQAFLWWFGLLVLVIAVVSPIDYWSDLYLTAHILQHILLAFVAPPLIVLGAPWLPLLRGLPRPWARRFGRLLQQVRAVPSRGPAVAALAAVVRFLARPWTAVVAFNMVMVFWHLPGPFDLAASNGVVHVWLAHGMFFGLGVGLWLQVFGSYPFRPVLPPPGRLLALVSTNAVMVVVAMTLVMFTQDLYPWYSTVETAASQAADQQIAGAILWVCGEVTFLPSILYTVARWLEEPERTAASRPHGEPHRAAVR